MSVATYPSERAEPSLRSVRVSGGVSLRCARRFGKSEIVELIERDGYKVRRPRGGNGCEAVLINTGGGIAGGDQISQEISVEAGASLTVSGQASERVYRAVDHGAAKSKISLNVADDGALFWLPQDTILYNHARFERTIEANIRASSRLLVGESLTFGRTAMGETLDAGLFRDRWRIRREGKLCFAENLLLDETAYPHLRNNAGSGGFTSILTLLYVAPDGEDQLPQIRRAMAEITAETRVGASAWDGMVCVRAMARGMDPIRKFLAELLPIIAHAELPRVWLT